MVEKIPGTFQSAEHYFASFVYPLLEETRAQLSLGLELISRAPFAEVICIDKVEPDEELLYNVRVDYWRNRSAGRCLDPYRTVPGDLVIFADAKLETFSDIQCLGRKTWAFALVTEVRENEIEDDGTTVCFKVRVSKERTEGDGKNKWTFMYFLINITTGERIWNALHMSGNLNIIKQVLFTDSTVKESCELCPESSSGVRTENFGTILSSKLNKSQMAAVLASLRKIHCNHKSSVELICGPPGTGKTRTISALLCALLGTNIRTLTCAPTAVAVKEVASRVMKHLKESFETDPQKDASICSLGDLLFFGDYDSTAVGSEMKEIYLDHRVERLAKCFEPLNGWRHSFNSMIVFLEGGVSEDRVSEDELSKMEEGSIDGSKGKRKTYLQLAREQFKSTSLHLREVVITLSTHIPKSFIMEHNFQAMLSLLGFLRSFESLLHQDNMVSEELENLFAGKKNVKHSSKSVADSSTLMEIRSECLHILKNLRNSLDELQFPKNNSKDLLIDFCFQTASSIFSTASDSHKLHLVDMKPLNILVIDEAAQLRECESTIPLQLPGIKLAILIGDKFQLPSRVTSNICDRAGFGRSLYERLSSLDHAKHFLNLQYRMHPSIMDEVGHSVKNMVEVAVLMKIVQNLYQDWRSGIKEELRIGVLSSYTAQGGEEDIILISTVRANNFGSVGVMADVKITNVALTRARHGLWILGSERTLVMSETVWKDIVHDAKDRHCLLNADEDCDLANTIFKVKAELDELDDLLNRDSSLFNSARWKVIFSENFRKAFYNLKSSHTQNTVIALLLKLSTGWRPKRRNIDLPCESSSMILKKFKVGYLYIVCSNDLEKECGYYTQVLKVWDILALEDIPKLVKHLDNLFEMYTDDYLTRCKKKSWEGELEIPMSWTTSYDIVQYKSLSNNATGRISNVSGLARRGGFENSIVSESFLIMKFYSVTFNMVRHFISGHDGRELDLPFELTDQERETIFFNRSSFILGRSGTGKTTVLSMKLFQKEQLFHIASEGLYEVEGHSSTHASQRNEIGECTGDAKGACLHQLFVTVSPRLCNAIRRQLSHFQSFASGGKFLVESSSLDLDYIDPVQFKDIPDSFVNIPSKSYPLVITFHKFLMMLDGTVGISYFSRFPDAHKPSRTVTLQSFIRSREDLTMRQIALFKYVSKNIDEGFVFSDKPYKWEAPVLIECGNFKDALSTIFGDSENAKGNAGFGAEQVILVRNDSAKEEISKYVGKKALVLTILECKGLEFRDVLLCNFFGSCPFKHHWRVLYQFMNKINLVDSKSLISFPSFDEAKHNVLCSELKQLYVAITRTRKDAQGMQVASRPDEWRSQGFKPCHLPAVIDTAISSSAAAVVEFDSSMNITMKWQECALKKQGTHTMKSIGKAEYAAKCFFELKNYERADSSNSAILQPKMIATANAWEMKDDTSLLKQGGHLRVFLRVFSAQCILLYCFSGLEVSDLMPSVLVSSNSSLSPCILSSPLITIRKVSLIGKSKAVSKV
ncbi:Helicase SEN1 [Vitis vinifera]|uniref:Helicase SEN1 n=1 Tax=Vitis vinifera TaxID=29760 RepID=A0A438JRR1_VITVI|nr:Helicase SEN1 [Vitis vinifera]